MSMIFDSHAHYDAKRFREDQKELLAQIDTIALGEPQ